MTRVDFSMKAVYPMALVTVGLLFSQLNAAPVTLEEAQNVALNWMQSKTGIQMQIKNTSLGASAISSAGTPMYRIVQLEPKGWVIVASDDTVKPILGYGLSPINTNSLPPAFVSWMSSVNESIKLAAVEHIADTKLGATNITQWNQLKADPTVPPIKFSDVPYTVKPLLWLGGSSENAGISWNQGEYYNDKCPQDANSAENGRVLTGCVATAMGQVMRYYSKPTVGTGSYSYTKCTEQDGCQHDYGTQGANFGATTYDWAHMPKKLDATSSAEEVDAVSTLLYHTGVSVGMDYGTGNGDHGSLSFYHNPNGAAADSAMENYFGYSIEFIEAKDYPNADGYVRWKTKVKNALANGYPLLYGGSSQASGGHAFVLDGYGTDGNDDVFHFNWGWGGELNGQFSLLGITPGRADFSGGQQAIIVKGDNANHNNNNTIGGGCTYNPRNKGFDFLIVFMVLLASLYPLGRKYLR